MRRSFLSLGCMLGLGALLGNCGGTTTILGADGSVPNDSGGAHDGSADSGGGWEASSDSSGGNCGPECPSPSPYPSRYRLCCNGSCVNPDNDPFNCGMCGTTCTGATPYCNGTCMAAPCYGAPPCPAAAFCCGNQCCNTSDLCCKSDGPQTGGATCFTPTPQQPTCPLGCAPLCVSDRNLKSSVEPVDEQAVLEAVSRMPVATWSYTSDPSTIRHMGPMAQDFHAAFGLGGSDRTYDPIDAHGVAFAAIKALNERLEEQGGRIERLEQENRRLRDEACRP